MTSSPSTGSSAVDGARWTGGAREAQARVNRSARIRGDNLSAVLELVHHLGNVSRSQLTKETGLNRSTIAALVADLVERGLVFETDPETAGEVGRPSPIVRPDPTTVALAVNPEVDAVTVGAVGLGGHVISQRRRALRDLPTPEEAVSVAAEEIAGLIASLGPDYRVVGVGVAVPGLVGALEGVVRLAPHLGWRDVPFAEMLSKATGLPVHAANDASLGANAERIFGAGRGVGNLIYLNGGASGIGGGIIVDGIPLRGVGGFAGEIGHTFVSANENRDPSGTRGSLEVEVNRAALADLLGITDFDSDELESFLLGSTDPLVGQEVERQLRFLSIAISNMVNVFNPELIVLGGFLASLDAASPGLLERLVLSQALEASAEGVRVARAQLRSSLLMIGAAELAFTELLLDPTNMSPRVARV
jgi:predicted NBD/HSP70 family sugar kinase